jgi:hypothetical protein
MHVISGRGYMYVIWGGGYLGELGVEVLRAALGSVNVGVHFEPLCPIN